MAETPGPAYLGGVGMTAFGRHGDRGLADLGREACVDALRDAQVAPSAVQAAYCGNALGAGVQGETGIGQSVLWELGIHGIPVVNVENACASGATALHLAWRDVAWGIHDVVLAVGLDKGVMPKGSVLRAGTGRLESQLGDIFPGLFALIAQQHMRTHGTTLEQMAQVSVKNHANGALNPLAQFNRIVTLEQALASPMVADPLTLFSCCPNSDGAAAAVVCSAKWLRAGSALRLAASVLGSGDYDPMRDLTYWASERRVVAQAYANAGLGPQDLDVVEVHDAFTIAEIAWQLRGQAQGGQIPAARVGLAQIMGGSKGNDAQACAVHILVNDAQVSNP